MSLGSFGGLKDGPTTIVEGVLAASSTVLAATMDVFGPLRALVEEDGAHVPKISALAKP